MNKVSENRFSGKTYFIQFIPGQLFEEEVLEAADLHLVLLLLLQQLRLAQLQLGLVVLERGRQQLAAESGPRGGEVDGGDGRPGGNCIKVVLPGKLILGYYFQENMTS